MPKAVSWAVRRKINFEYKLEGLQSKGSGVWKDTFEIQAFARIFVIGVMVNLNEILDEEECTSVGDGHQGEAEIRLVEAEAQAEALRNRLSVAQKQFSEYANEKAGVEHELSKTAGEVEVLLSQLSVIQEGGSADVASAGNGGARNKEGDLYGEIARLVRKLKEELESCANEASITAKQAHQEAQEVMVGKRRTADEAELGLAGDGNGANGSKDDEMEDAEDMERVVDDRHDLIAERAKYIPVRLSHDERRLLRLLEAALNVSEYTDKVDILSYRNKHARVHAQIKDLCAILCGLVVAQNFRRGQQLISERSFDELQDFFQGCFEIGRRHKVMNPDKMRDTYGKLMYMLMDSVEPEITELLQFSCAKDIVTVYSVLEEGGALKLLDDSMLPTAIAEIKSDGRARHQIQLDIKKKEKARDALARKYRNSKLGEEELLVCLYSLSDNNSYLRFNRDPIDRMITYLAENFKPDSVEDGLSLAIQGGSKGSRLTHSHQRQYTYVLQTLTLWREISHEMFKLWWMADKDMLSDRNSYRLQNTGQGLQRVQGSPLVGRCMSAIISRCQQRIGSWVGSSVVHLGDHNVPNALMFIDKYTQVPRILNPIVLVLDEIPRIVKDPGVSNFISSSFGSVDRCRKEILADFFRHGFDGSGADNSFDAGSCIDGRLTSAWNWCSKIEKKKFYNIFKLAGFGGFDGDFKG
eukprot:jgi/Picsp_1/1844/NSC_05311-R1_protein